MPEYTERDGQLLIRGKIEYRVRSESVRDRIYEIACWVLLAPIWMIAFAVRGLIWAVKRMLHKPKNNKL